jgi:hypothetical protein
MTEDERLQAAVKARMRVWRDPVDGLQTFARDRLKIMDKNGALVPLVFNESQMLLHEAIETQKKRRGLVRMVGLKGRRQGFSTYVAARFYWQAATRFGRRVYILSHQKASTQVLFSMVERFIKYDPFAPKVGADNAQMLTFPDLEGSYTVATAGNAEGGRGGEANLFHGSEFGFWENAEQHFASSIQTVSLVPGTEVILESTSGGPTGKFYEMFQRGQTGEDIYESVFIPWHKEKGNIFPVSADFKLDTIAPDENTPSEKEIAATFGLTDEQMHFRRIKINELGLLRFKREFPATPDDAWSSLETDTFINPAAVLRARGRNTDPSGPLIMGVDPAGGGGDRFAVCIRQGNAVTLMEHRNKIDRPEALAWLRELIDKHDPDRVNIDAGNIGQYLITDLRSFGPKYAEKVRSVNFGATSQHKMADKTRVGPENRRAEMWGRLKEWIEDRDGCASIPNSDDLGSDLVSVRQIYRANNDWLLMSKADMKKNNLRSPDLGDALALTFASKEYFPDRAKPKPSVLTTVWQNETVETYDDSTADGGWML